MKWTKDRSIKLSLFCIYFFSAVLLILNVFPIVKPMRTQILIGRLVYGVHPAVFLIIFAICSVFAWICLYHLFRLLKNMGGETVFTKDNVRHLRMISWCCAGVSAVTFAGCFFWLPLFIITAASAFMMLIVRIVKNVMDEAADMKNELDYTV